MASHKTNKRIAFGIGIGTIVIVALGGVVSGLIRPYAVVQKIAMTDTDPSVTSKIGNYQGVELPYTTGDDRFRYLYPLDVSIFFKNYYGMKMPSQLEKFQQGSDTETTEWSNNFSNSIIETHSLIEYQLNFLDYSSQTIWGDIVGINLLTGEIGFDIFQLPFTFPGILPGETRLFYFNFSVVTTIKVQNLNGNSSWTFTETFTSQFASIDFEVKIVNPLP